MTVTVETYLETVIDERIVPMLKEVSAALTPAVKQVSRFANPKLDPPFWWVYPGGLALTSVTHGRYTEIASINLRLVLGYAQQTGYNGQYEGYLWQWLPTVSHYLLERRGLVFQAGQSAPDHLEPKDVLVGDFTPFGVFEDSTLHLGTETALTLPFSFYVSPYPGNP